MAKNSSSKSLQRAGQETMSTAIVNGTSNKTKTANTFQITATVTLKLTHIPLKYEIAIIAYFE